MKKTIIFDIDGTLANLDHRLHLVNGPKKDWPEFLARVKDDLPIEQTIFLNNLLNEYTLKYDEFDIVLSSGRSENERKDTEEWLAENGVYYDKLYMRAAGDTRADYVVKLEMLAQMRADGREPWLVFDDRESVVAAWREAGLFVLQCAPKETFEDVYNFNPKGVGTEPFIIMVGPSGSGKTSRTKLLDYDSAVISSDQLRELFTGDFRNQEANERVFLAMHELAQTRLKLGLPVVLDATHIKRADRMKAAKLVPSHVPLHMLL